MSMQKPSLRLRLLASALVLGTFTAALPLTPHLSVPEAAAQSRFSFTIGFDSFRDELSRYGDWVYSDRWGTVWIHFTDDCVVRMSENKPALTGKTALGQGFADLLKSGRYGIKSLSTFARGPLVANDRVDWKIEDGGKRGAEFPIAGVFVVRGGKIQEWSDYLAKA